ncbi:uncharacterized protein LOC110098555 [Dendrobium catenatum]|uniref:LysM domain-containing protein n=1 Tax=Dendrobium catenatum TaxID=906689 RepID=A0A2I0V738_9ASPA|nr:uncharacterized protein LOC110098555 [Dendrobium catenatum]PKU59220.1 hypothetical protein MA16_Dca022582 [Dendrobium catenatum]
MASLSRRRLILEKALATADSVSSYLALGLALLMLMSSVWEPSSAVEAREAIHGAKLDAGGHRPCDELYVVGEGETLHTISAKCEDPYIVERNPHVNDPDDVYPGLVLQIIPSRPK